MTKKSRYLGYMFATLAATFNGMVGIFSVKIMDYGLHPITVVFYKCLIGTSVITTWLIISRKIGKWIEYLKDNYAKIGICAFCGFFMACYFETLSYNHLKVPVAVFLLLGSSLITTFVLSSLLNKQKIKNYQILSCIIALLGLWLIFETCVIHINQASLLGILPAI